MKFSLTTVLALFLLSNCYQPVSNNFPRTNRGAVADLPPNPEPGKCYAKSLVPDLIEKQPMEIPVFIGDENDTTVKRESREFVLTKASTKWEKKKADRNCMSRDPNDCLVWCLVETPEEKIERMIVLDTSDTSSFKMETIYFNELKKKGGFTEWFEVLCENQIDETVVTGLQNRLFVEQFLTAIPETPKIDTKTKAALKAYQREHGLPVGNLDFKTLAHLGINY